MGPRDAPRRPMPPARDAPAPRALLVDGGVVVVLALTAFVTRRAGLPTNGLWHDDAWVAFAATRGSLGDLLAIGFSHPGFTGLLMLWGHLTGADPEAMVWPMMLAGVAGPPLLYLALRTFGYARSISVLLASVLVAADVHAVYSGRAKTYVVDVLLILGITALLPRLARTTWTWPIASAWVVAALLLSSFSGFTLIAAAVAGVVLVVHPASDRVVRVVAVGLQAAASLAYIAVIQNAYSEQRVEVFWRRNFDAYPSFDANPLHLGDELLDRLRRIVEVLTPGPRWWVTLCVVVALLGLAYASFSVRSRLRGRFLATVLVVAFVAGLAGVVPFGPSDQGGAFGEGQRLSLWLVPVVTFGLAAALALARSLLDRSTALRRGFDCLLTLLAVAVVATALNEGTRSYPSRGASAAVEFIEQERQEGDAVLLVPASPFVFGIETHLGVSIRQEPDTMIGFAPDFDDSRVGAVPVRGDVGSAVDALAGDTDRVFVFAALSEAYSGQSLSSVLSRAGFELEQIEEFDDATVEIWTR